MLVPGSHHSHIAPRQTAGGNVRSASCRAPHATWRGRARGGAATSAHAANCAGVMHPQVHASPVKWPRGAKHQHTYKPWLPHGGLPLPPERCRPPPLLKLSPAPGSPPHAGAVVCSACDPAPLQALQMCTCGQLLNSIPSTDLPPCPPSLHHRPIAAHHRHRCPSTQCQDQTRLVTRQPSLTHPPQAGSRGKSDPGAGHRAAHRMPHEPAAFQAVPPHQLTPDQLANRQRLQPVTRQAATAGQRVRLRHGSLLINGKPYTGPGSLSTLAEQQRPPRAAATASHSQLPHSGRRLVDCAAAQQRASGRQLLATRSPWRKGQAVAPADRQPRCTAQAQALQRRRQQQRSQVQALQRQRQRQRQRNRGQQRQRQAAAAGWGCGRSTGGRDVAG